LAVAPLPNRALPFLDGPNVALPWYRWFQQRPDAGADGTPGTPGTPGAAGPPGPSADDFLSFVNMGAQNQSGILSVTSTTADLTVASSYGNVRLTVVSAPKWDHVRTESFTGDATGGPTNVDGSADWSTALTLATVNTNTGTWGDATHIGQFTVNAKGLITAAASVAITYPIPTFGTGAPSTLVGEGALYFDTTLTIYVGYVQHSSAWHQF
jgi:hypothetical protein